MDKKVETETTTSPYRTPTNERENIPEFNLEESKKRKQSALEKKESDHANENGEGSLSRAIDLPLITNKLQDHLGEKEEKGDILKTLNVILEMLKQEMRFPIGLTFDDVLLVPQHSNINSRSEVNLTTRFSRKVKLNIPFVSSPMDTVTEADMAIEMARSGGIGIIHRFMSIEEQVKQIEKVKKKEAHIITNPYSVEPTETCGAVLKLREQIGIETLIVVEKKLNSREQYAKIKSQWVQEKIVGIITRRDLNSFKDPNLTVEKFMTPLDKLVKWTLKDVKSEESYPNPAQLEEMMCNHKVEKIPLITEDNTLYGMVFLKDILRTKERPIANLDLFGRLVVGAAVGAKDDYIERSRALLKAGCDVLVVDIANGHSELCIETVRNLKQEFPDADIVAGSIATGEGAEKLIEAGADGIRCGIGNGAICITRVVAGAGVPQLSALLSVAPVCRKYNIPLISDGGNRNSGNMCKALGAGADCIMLGRLVAGCDESPSKAFYRDGKLVKIYRGMAGYGANVAKAQRTGVDEPENKKFTPEGVEGYIPYAGPLKDVLTQFISGIRSGMSYTGAKTIPQHQQKARFIRMTKSGERESGVHDINKIS